MSTKKRATKRQEQRFWKKIDAHYEKISQEGTPFSKEEFIKDTKEMLEKHSMPQVLRVLKTGVPPQLQRDQTLANLFSRMEKNPENFGEPIWGSLDDEDDPDE